jgi:hypothetical protein
MGQLDVSIPVEEEQEMLKVVRRRNIVVKGSKVASIVEGAVITSKVTAIVGSKTFMSHHLLHLKNKR